MSAKMPMGRVKYLLAFFVCLDDNVAKNKRWRYKA